MIRIGVLTSSRADYGIYLPLLKALRSDNQFDLKLVVFGTHLSKYHGNTITQIEEDGFDVFQKIESFIIGDSSYSVSTSFSLTALKFTEFWELNKSRFDFIIALGDRFELAAAVAASIPFRIKIAHIHAGETSLGAIDNIYRHTISLASSLHFVSAEPFEHRLMKLLDNPQSKIFNIGSLSLENLSSFQILSIQEFQTKWGIDLSIDTILLTVHPETADLARNQINCNELVAAVESLSQAFQIVITMPNADTSSLLYRDAYERLAHFNKSIKVVENFGTISYFSCMSYCRLMIGNTSSGIIEAASFNKYVLNLGDRQKNRLCSDNVIHVPFERNSIISKTLKFIQKDYEGENIYFRSNPSAKVIEIIKNEYENI